MSKGGATGGGGKGGASAQPGGVVPPAQNFYEGVLAAAVPPAGGGGKGAAPPSAPSNTPPPAPPAGGGGKGASQMRAPGEPLTQQQLANAGHGAQGASQTLPTQAAQQAQQNAFGNNEDAQGQGPLSLDEIEQYNKWRMSGNRVSDQATRAYERYNQGLDIARQNWANERSTGTVGELFNRFYEGVGGGEQTSSHDGPGGMETYADTYKKYRYDFRDPNKYSNVQVIRPGQEPGQNPFVTTATAPQKMGLDEFNELAGKGRLRGAENWEVRYSGGRDPNDFDTSKYDAEWAPSSAPTAFDADYYREQAGIGADADAWAHYIREGRDRGYDFRPEYGGRMPSAGPVQAQYPTQSYYPQQSALSRGFQPRLGPSMGYGNPFQQRFDPAVNMRYSQPVYRPQPQYQPRFAPRPQQSFDTNFLSRLLRGF